MTSNTNPPSLLDINDRVYYMKARISLLHEIFILLIHNPDDSDFPASAWRGMQLLAMAVLEDMDLLEKWTDALMSAEREAIG